MSPGPTPAPPAPRTSQGKCLTVGGRADGGFLQYAQLLNPRNSMSITNTKGLLNMPGQNNCFLNSAVQVLWHLDIFRRSFRELCGHACMEDSCIFCALKELFAQFQYSQESALPPDALRRALAETFCDQRRFQLGFMDDAAECFENILMRIHFHIANNESEDMCSALHCIPHQKFAMTLVEQTVCHACGATSEPLPFTQMVHYVPSSALCSQAKLMKEKSDQMPSFSELLKKAGGLGDLRDCPSSCGAVIQIRKTLMNHPEIVSIGLVWDSERPTIEHIMDVFKTIGMSLKLQDVFHSVVDSRWASAATHQLVGIVTYYGKHYSTFFFHTKLRVWIYFDDAAVREIGPKWEQVVEKCCRGHFQPLLLLYANPHGSPVNTSTAPRVVTVVPGHKKNIAGKDSCSISLQHEKNSRIFQHSASNNQRRALTPNPEMSCDMSANIQPRRAVTPSGELSWCDDSTKDQSSSHNSVSKDSSPYSPTVCVNYNNGCQTSRCNVRSPDQAYTRCNNITGESNLVTKPNRVSARLSIPNCTFYSDLYQPNPTGNVVKNNTLNRPASVDDILQSTANTAANTNETEKIIYCEPDENLTALESHILDEHSVDTTYISRKAVENVLHLQKLQRQRSVNSKAGHIFIGQRNSSSSLESLDNVFVFRDKTAHPNMKLDIPDATNMARRRDSGNWSGDRNSASSSSTTSLDNPYFYVIGNKRPPNCGRNIGRPGESVALTDPGYDSFSLSSSDSYPSAINNSPGKIDSRLGQIPENVQTAFVPYDLSQLQYCLKDIKSNEHFPFGFKDECDKLCAEADIFVAKSIERENVGDISMAALLSETAAAKARAAMDVPYTNSQALAMAKMKHSMCLIRSSNLHKKLKEAEAALRRKQKEVSSENCRTHPNNVANGKRVSDIATSINKEGSENANDESPRDQKRLNVAQNGEHSNSDKNIEIYATLPKRSLKKKGTISSFVESFTGEDSSDEKISKEKVKITDDGKNESNIQKNDANSSDEKSSKSPSNKKKTHSLLKSGNKDSDLSDYSSEWEHTKKPSLYRTYSGPTSNSKNELSDMSPVSNPTFVDHPTKKQHRIRRKLMGGFMRRKNRSLPDLREGQDSGGETTRSFDDCFFTQTPVSCRKRQEIKNAGFPHSDSSASSLHHESRKVSQNIQKSIDVAKVPKKNVTRTHTPPPYKPPPPIGHSNPSCSLSPKRPSQCSSDLLKSEFAQSNCVLNSVASNSHKELSKSRSSHHPPLCRDSKAHRKLTAHFSSHNHDELPSSSAVWLKELQLKQEEINQKRKLQEERERWLMDCSSGADEKLACSNKSSEKSRDVCLKSQILLNDKDQMPQSLQKSQVSNSDSDQHKSVRDLASKFEKIAFTPASVEVTSEEKGNSTQSPVHPENHLLNVTAAADNKIYMIPSQTTSNVPVHSENSSLNLSAATDNKIYMMPPQNLSNVQCGNDTDHSRPHLNSNHHHVPQASEKTFSKQSESKNAIPSGKDRLDSLSGAKQPYSNQSTSGSIYNPHLTDAQLTNVLRIGTNRSSFRNANLPSDVQEDSFVRYPRDVYVFHEAKRPDKPPDYETAIQRLELLRNDRNFAKFYSNNNCINFEAILEQAKRRRGPKKSVTFSDKVVLVACAGDEDNDFIPNPLLERVYKQHFMQTPNADSMPLSTEGNQNSKSLRDSPDSSSIQDPNHVDVSKQYSQSPCHLCHKKTVEAPNLYCPDCAYYMSRFQQK